MTRPVVSRRGQSPKHGCYPVASVLPGDDLSAMDRVSLRLSVCLAREGGADVAGELPDTPVSLEPAPNMRYCLNWTGSPVIEFG